MKAIAIILFTVLIHSAHAQEFSYKQFTTADGLPSNVVYAAYQDKEGYIWFCTNAGVSRFNGISFQNFTVEHGLSDNEVFGAFQTSEDRIWFRTFSNKLCYYENGSFHNYLTDPWLNKTFGGMKIAYVDDEGLVWTRNYLDSFVYIMDEKNKAIKRIYAHYRDSSIIVTPHGIDTISIADEKLLYTEMANFGIRYKPVIDKLPDVTAYFMFSRRHLEALRAKNPSIPLHFMYHIFVNSHPIQRFKLHELIHPFKNKAEKKYLPNAYWLTTANKGIAYGADLFALDEKPDMYLSDRNINNILIDNEGNYWFTSPTEGVFLLTAHGVKTYESGKNEGEIYSVTGNDEYVVIGKNNEVVFINRHTGKKITWRYDLVENSSVYNRVKDMLIDGTDRCWIATDLGAACLQFSSKGARRVHPSTLHAFDPLVGAMKSLSPGSDSTIYLGSHARLYRIDNRRKAEAVAFKRITAVVEVGRDHALAGSTDGLYTYKNGKLDTFRATNGIVTQHITDLGKTDEFVCVGTNDKGLAIIRNGHIFRITVADTPTALISNICRKVFIDAGSNIWVCTNEGLSRVSISSWQPFRFSVQSFTTDDGLISNDVNDVFVSGDTVWVATSGGLSFFSQRQIKQNGQLPAIYISQVDTLTRRSFGYRDKIVIGLEGISYESLGKLRYRYRLKGLYQDWRYTDRNQLLYDVLPPGEYELEVYSINRFGQESENPARVAFTVVPPWWKTDWAYALYAVALISLLVVALLLVRRISRQKERNRMKHIQQLQQLELKALRSQMNPHFIFNTLNAVQKYILENDKESSYRYLTRFSKLIRGFLENSRQTTISLQHELDLLRAYMEMEALRFRHKFTYEIEIDPTLDTASVFIPSMLIQPYVENAIWHGIQHKKANGFVKLSVQDMGGNVLKCRILDNGIGRKRAGEIESASGSQHQPVGMTITQQRLELINQRLKQAVSVNFIDIAEESHGAGTGTIVELIVTYQTKKP
ncbi:MAG TPA: histidine kinase [Chitinophagaceae bacterium]|nr:histidine kinase [Chitinophagaceae bacterium]